MGIEAGDEEVQFARQALLQAAAVGPVKVRCIGRARDRLMYEVLNQRSHRRFRLETLRQAALSAHTPFTLEKRSAKRIGRYRGRDLCSPCPTRHCHNCDEQIERARQLFCDRECARDFEKRERGLALRGD